MVAVGVVGGGLLGSMVTLFAAARGWDVELIEARPGLMAAASAANEGKVHLGPVFALGDSSTHELMLRGALTFAPLLEEAVGSEIDWPEMSTDAFEYLVMPTSLLDAPNLAIRYSAMNAMFERLSNDVGSEYLGRSIHQIVDPNHSEDATTGLPRFSTTERAIDPLRLRELVLTMLASTPNASIHVSRNVLKLASVPGGVEVTWQDPSTAPRTQRFDYVVNCAWENQLAVASDATAPEHNFRLKTAVRLPRSAGGRTVTLVQGPFGDVVSHRDYTYASWYPDGRLTNEFGREPSTEARRLLASIDGQGSGDEAERGWRSSLVHTHIHALKNLGLLPDDVDSGELVGGFIVGHGERDIDHLGSQLHSRAEFGAREFGALVVPSNFKLTTVPLAAARAIEVIELSMARTVLA